MDRARFLNLWQRSCADPSPADHIIDELEAGYGEPHRRYHTAWHIAYCLAQFDLASGQMAEPDTVELALWFHDLIYDPFASDNELQSAERFKHHAGGRMDPQLVDRVYGSIMATVHTHAPSALEQQYTVDIDLSSFGLPPDEFVKDSVNVRNEFPHLTEAEFAERNCRFLQSLMDRPHVYFTEFYRNRHEQAARRNLSERIKKLCGLTGG